MSEHPFQRLIGLIDFDQDIRAKQKTIDDLTKQVQILQQQIDEQIEQLGHAKRISINSRKTVDEIELEIKELDQEEKNKKKRLDGISHYKEYQSLQVEIARLQSRQNEREQTLLDAWNKLETAQREFEARQKEHDEKMLQLNASLQEKQQQVATLQKERDERLTSRAQKEEGVPEEWLEKYSVMRARVSDPAVTIEGTSCGACFSTIPNQEMLRLKRGALLQCKGCFRFIYIKEAIEKSGGESSTDETT